MTENRFAQVKQTFQSTPKREKTLPRGNKIRRLESLLTAITKSNVFLSLCIIMFDTIC